MRNSVNIEKWCDVKSDIERVMAAIYIHTHFQNGQFPENDDQIGYALKKIKSNNLYRRDFMMFKVGVGRKEK